MCHFEYTRAEISFRRSCFEHVTELVCKAHAEHNMDISVFFIIIFFSFISATRTGTGPTAELNARSGADCKLSTNLASRCLIMDTVSQKSLNGIDENCGRPLCPFAKDDYRCIFCCCDNKTRTSPNLHDYFGGKIHSKPFPII